MLCEIMPQMMIDCARWVSYHPFPTRPFTFFLIFLFYLSSTMSKFSNTQTAVML